MSNLFSEIGKLYIKAMGEKLDKDILESEENMTKKNEYPKVQISHFRNRDCMGRIVSKGGGTFLKLEIRKGVCYVGVAYCWKGDVYNKRKGKSIALGRLLYALSALGFPEYEETKKWLFSKVGKIDGDLWNRAFHGLKIE